MAGFIARIGEINYNKFGSKMIIIEYRKYNDINVYFPEYDWTAENVRYDHFKEGKIKCIYERRTFDVGYLGEGKYNTKENGKKTKCYKIWVNMLRRCYDEKYHERQSTYIGCKVSERFLNFQNFGEWDNDNYYEIEGERMELDKDILVKHNKIYSPETCIYVPQRINKLFTKSNKTRGDLPIGVSSCKNGKYRVNCCLLNLETGKSESIYLGLYDIPEQAFEVYKYYKEKNIKQVADYYKNKIPQKLYNAMYRYKVEMTD